MNAPLRNTVKLAGVKSSTVMSMGHDPLTNTLAVQYHRGGIHHYHGVTADKFATLKASKSLGKHLLSHIKPSHKCAKCED